MFWACNISSADFLFLLKIYTRFKIQPEPNMIYKIALIQIIYKFQITHSSNLEE